MPIQKLKDDDLMPSGKYANYPMIEVPADYLLWLYDNNKAWEPVKTYIEENMDVLKKEVNKK